MRVSIALLSLREAWGRPARGAARPAAQRRFAAEELPFLAHRPHRSDDSGMRTTPERRTRRSTTPHIALTLQLETCCDSGVEAMVLADGDGLPLASAGDGYVCEEVAGKIVI